MPPGLSLSAAGLLSGTPEDGIETTLTIRIFDAGGGTGSGRLDLTIVGASGGPRFETELLPTGRAGESYEAALEASGGQPPYAFTSVGRDLPEGIVLAEDGRLSGEPEEGGVFELRFRKDRSALLAVREALRGTSRLRPEGSRRVPLTASAACG